MYHKNDDLYYLRTKAYGDFKDMVTEENYVRYQQRCELPLSAFTEDERKRLGKEKIVFDGHKEIMEVYKDQKYLKKDTFTIGCTAGTVVMSLNDSKYAQYGVLAFASPKDFSFLKFYRVVLNEKSNKELTYDDEMRNFELLAYGYSPYSNYYQSTITLQQLILSERGMMKTSQEALNLKERHNFIDLLAYEKNLHPRVSSDLRFKMFYLYKNDFLTDLRRRLRLKKKDFELLISNPNYLSDIFGLFNAVYVDIDLTRENLSWWTVEELKNYILFY